MRRFNSNITVACACVVLGWLLFWLIANESSPLSGYTHTHDWPDNYWLFFNLIPLSFAQWLPPDSLEKMILAITLLSLWWFGLGFLMSALVRRFATRRHGPA